MAKDIEMKANESFDNGVFCDTEVNHTRLMVKLFSK